MIVVKTIDTLRVKINRKNKIILMGSTFSGRTIEDLPEWLQEHIEYFRKTPHCNTLLIKETFIADSSTLEKAKPALKVQGTLIDDAVKVKTEVKKDKKVEEPLPVVKLDPKIQPKETKDLPPVELEKEAPKKETRKRQTRKRAPKKTIEKIPAPIKLKKRTPK